MKLLQNNIRMLDGFVRKYYKGNDLFFNCLSRISVRDQVVSFFQLFSLQSPHSQDAPIHLPNPQMTSAINELNILLNYHTTINITMSIYFSLVTIYRYPHLSFPAMSPIIR